MRDYWFRCNSWGWGFIPVSIKGYLLLAVLIIVIILTGFVTGMYNEVSILRFFIYFVLLILEIAIFGFIAGRKVKR